MGDSTPKSLVGRSADVVITDPWEFMSVPGTAPLAGRIESVESEAL